MENEVIYIPNTKVLFLEKFNEYFKINLSGEIKIIKNIEKIGLPFSIITKKAIDEKNSFAETLEFKELANPIPLASPLENYLRKAHISFTLAKREENIIQYLGFFYEKSNCQFYLIKDNLKLETYFKRISPTSESSSNHFPFSDWTFQLSTSKIHHPQEAFYSLQ